MFNKRKFHDLIIIIVVATVLFSGLQPSTATAQAGDGIKRQVNAGSGRVSFISPENGRVVSASMALGTSIHPQDPAMALAIRFGPEFGLIDPELNLSEMKKSTSNDGRISVRYQQNYQGIPVMGGELIVNTNADGDLYSINGEASSNLPLHIQPTIDPDQAAQAALQVLAEFYEKAPTDFVASTPELWIFDESLLQPSTRPVELVWRMEVTAKDMGLPVRELVLVNAQRGNISLHFNQIDTAWYASVGKAGVDTARALGSSETPLLGSPLVSTYTANNTTSLPGTFLCNQTQPGCTGGSNPDADAAHTYAIGTYYLYANVHSRDSIDNAGMTIKSTVNYRSGYANAGWNGYQMIYGDAFGFAQADDVVAHELTHGVTNYESNLFYYYQSGAINESFSDLWGEYYDQVNGQGNDSAGAKWLVGEDVSGLGAIRSMNNPSAYNDPDKMTSPYYYTTTGDNGGVHTNSGINNKAVYLMVDGGSFNSKTVTALGWTKTIAIYYEAQSNLLTSGADYSDLYYALQQACTNLIGQKGITSANCIEVKDAVDGVEMNSQPALNFNTNAPLCTTAGVIPSIVFSDNLEDGIANWTFSSSSSFPRWQYDSPYGAYAHSGSHFIYADDYVDSVYWPSSAGPVDAFAKLISIAIPPKAYLHFAHAYDYGVYDGGVLEYSINNGSTWLDAGSLFDYNGYNGTINNSSDNPLKGRPGFVSVSHGYISSRLNLSALAGKNVNFRWRMGLSSMNDLYRWGWWLDDIQVYGCPTFADVSNTYWAWIYIERLYNAGITGGCNLSPLQYCPETTVTRSQMAVFLLRGIHGSSYNPPAVGASTGFGDVPVNYWSAGWIKQLAAEGITGGCGSGNYCPEYPVTRDQMAVFLLRSKYGSSYNPPAVGGSTGFGDVPANHWAAAWIKQLVAEGITSGCGNGNYCPDIPVSRAQMAVFLVKTFGLP